MQNRLKNRMISPALNEDGIAMLTSLMIMVLLLVMAGATLLSVRQEIQITGNVQGSVQALHAAEAGAEKVYDVLMLGDTNGDGVVDGLDLVNGSNDLDSNGTLDFLQVFRDKQDIGTLTNRFTVNSGTNIQADIWVDASAAPTVVSIHSRGNPAGTNSEREVTLDVTTSAESNVYGALNNST